ncbi:MAG: carboxylate--amine ligase [Deltaproteobacteria bacterium HGW-Deltaproteobacteria-13]|jgi:succinyl-CoA synthetase beta subunit|nr:MAG: carboxylate--amine ligase [Deltaproteobacteria bacterium HGW-Deltaproteobacteria-13]
MDQILRKAIERGQKSLSEYESKAVIESAGVSITREKLARSREQAVTFAEEIGYPVALKGCSGALAHKTEAGVVKLNLTDAEAVREAYDEITGRVSKMDGVLVQEMIKGNREFVIGLTRDPQFGPCVMFGIGGIFTEVMKDVSFRIAPFTESDAEEMIEEIKMKKLLGEFRGSPAVDREALVRALVGIGELALRHSEIAEIDINPLIIAGNKPVAADALVILTG